MFRKVFGQFIPPDLDLNQKDIMINCCFHTDSNASLSISTDPNKPIYHCFGCHAKGSIVGAYMQLNNVSYPEAMKQLDINTVSTYTPPSTPTPKPPKPITDYTNEVMAAHNIIFEDFQTHCKNLYELTGLTLPTAMACVIGFATPSFMTGDKHWILPIFRYPDFKCIGYEVRHKEFKKDVFINKKSGKPTKVIKAPNTPSILAYVYQGHSNKKAIVCEGPKDSYFMYQYLSEKNKGQPVEESILTPSCGVGHLPELIKENPLEEFENVIFCLDADDAGNKAKEEIAILNPRYKFFSGLLEGEDWELYYKRQRSI